MILLRSFLLCGLVQVCFAASAFAQQLHIAEAIDIAGGKMTVIFPAALDDAAPDLLVHFHGAPDAAAKAFERAGLDCVLVTVNFNGLSTAYSRPFVESPELLQKVMDEAMMELRRQKLAAAGAEWGSVCLSSFSAGYGATRELLKNPDCFERINGLIAADSIYASLEADEGARFADHEQMKDFARFAKQACRGEKTFIVSHSQLETPYASTVETADYLLQSNGMQLEPVAEAPADRGPLRLTGQARCGGFWVLSYAGADGEAHMQHLRHIDTWWRELPLKKSVPASD